MTPKEQLTGKDFEVFVKQRCDQLRAMRLASIGRYGVQAARRADQWVILSSLPDFEGVMNNGVQAIFDAKVCSGSSMSLKEYHRQTNGARSRQLSHMIERSAYGVRCFFLMHWNARELRTRMEPAITYAFPIHHDHRFWQEFEAGEIKSIRRFDCESYGQEIAWTLIGEKERRYRPDVLSAVRQHDASLAGVV